MPHQSRVPINTASRGAQLAHILANSEARLLVLEAEFANAVNSLEGGLPSLQAVWLIGDVELAERWPHPARFPAPAEPVPEAAIGPGDTVAILYTSGTTGVSKGVCCPHAQYFWWGVNTARLLGLRLDDVQLTTLPLFHTNALNTFYQALLTGAALVVEPRFSASGFAASLSRHGANVTYLLGAMVPILLSRPAGELDRAHHVRVALGPGVPERFHPEFLERFGIELLDGYGSTETNFVLAARCLASVGGRWAQSSTGSRRGWSMTRTMRCPTASQASSCCALTSPSPSPRAISACRTRRSRRGAIFGSIPAMMRDADGHFRFIDRMKDAIRRRGENVSSYEVEQVLLSHPDIAGAAAFPVRSELAEDEVMVAVVLRAGHILTPAVLAEYCKGRVPIFAIPRFIELLTALPMTENGKVQKFRLRERGVTAATWDREVVQTMWHRRQMMRLGFVKYGIRLNLHQHFRADEATHLYHGASRADVTKCLAVCPPDQVGVTDVGDVDDGTHHVLQTGSHLHQRTANSDEDVLGLHIGVAGQRIATGCSSSDMHLCPDTYRATISVDLFEWAAGRNHLSCHKLAPCYEGPVRVSPGRFPSANSQCSFTVPLSSLAVLATFRRKIPTLS